MNKRARNRLIGVTAIVLLAVVAIFASIGSRGGTAYYKSVKEIAEDQGLVGERVKVGGAVVAGSWDKKANPMTFSIRDEKDTGGTGAVVKVVYSGAVPSTFGDGVTAIVTGELDKSGTIQAGEMITKCPSKYESATGALPIADLVGKGESMVGKPTKATGFVKAGTVVAPGGDVRFVVTADKTGGTEVKVFYEGALPAGMVDGSQVVISGELDSDGRFIATGVAMEQGQK
ncbi:MAG: cytochrome c maturation protein CcmE [Actinobacteria bacterium]|nr:MAG: cytochrome c maturation protein CcmE [Actinomycetota bacterium]